MPGINTSCNTWQYLTAVPALQYAGGEGGLAAAEVGQVVGVEQAGHQLHALGEQAVCSLFSV